jgi:bacillolysin
MKKHYLTTLFVISTTIIFGQVFQKKDITELGVSKRFITLERQTEFYPDSLKKNLNLNPLSDLVLYSTEQDNIGFIHYRYFQTFKGFPIENTMYVAHTKNGKLISFSGEIILDFKTTDKILIKNTNLKIINPNNALKAALSYIKTQKYLKEKSNKTILFDNKQTKPELVWFNSDDKLLPKNLRLAYKIEIHEADPLSNANYYIDANTKELLGRNILTHNVDSYNSAPTKIYGSKMIHSDYSNGMYYLIDNTRGKGIEIKNAQKSGNPVFTNSYSNWNLTGSEQNALDVMYGLETTYDFYNSKFNRNSLDGNGLRLIGIVNDDKQNTFGGNAAWEDKVLKFGRITRNGNLTDDGVTSLDVIGHEFTHGVTSYAHKLKYEKESGAINESFSDIMGKGIQFNAEFGTVLEWNWKIGNNLNHPNLNRDMRTPHTYLGKTTWTSLTGCNPDRSNDHCGVHSNSGLGNYMFYLMVNGGTGTNELNEYFNFKGIGLENALKIIYRSQVYYLFPNATYNDWYRACNSAAADIGGFGGLYETSMNVWGAVGVTDLHILSPNNIKVSSIGFIGTTINWDKAENTLTYTLMYKKDTETEAEWHTIDVNDNNIRLSGLSPGTNYVFYVRSNGSKKSSDYSVGQSFKTISVPFDPDRRRLDHYFPFRF